MALPFAYFFLCLFFFFPRIYFSCPESWCGEIKILPPFFPNTADPWCTGKYMIQCENNSKPMIKFNDHEYPVKDISYQEKVLILQDQALGRYFLNGHCGFLYNFSDPIHNFQIPARSPSLSFENSSDCGRDFDAISRAFLPMRNDSHHYHMYYWDESSQQPPAALSSNCLAAEPTFEWVLSFSQHDTNLSLQSAGFSRKFVLQEDCFYCKVTGQSCSSSNGTGDLSCLCEDICKTNKGSSSRKNLRIVIVSVTGTAGVILLACLVSILLVHRHSKFHKNAQKIRDFLENYGSIAPKRYKYSDVKRMTKSFSEKLGQGGYGSVFKGSLSDGRPVAVKVLTDSKGDGEDFVNEVDSIGRTSHVNVVSLLGFCLEGSKRALIYDFMCNGSLEKFIFLEKSRAALGWEKLYQIAVGIARGLEYLHSGCNTRIVHFDIKPHNILLDEDFSPKISDFGLAKLCQRKESVLSMEDARGTIGYIAPEVFSRTFGVISSKSDVYSYGMMLLEMAGGRKNTNPCVQNSSELYFPNWIYDHLNQNGGLQAFTVTTETDEEIARKLILVGLWCIQTTPQNRPSMSRVIEMLEGSTNDLKLPPKPYLSSPLETALCTSSVS